MNNNKVANDVLIVMPSYNEVKNLDLVVKRLSEIADLIVVNDGSIDGTLNFLNHNNIEYIDNGSNIGYEKSIAKGIDYGLTKNYKYIITVDADGQHTPKMVLDIISKLLQGYDIVVGDRKTKQRWAEWIFSVVGTIYWGVKDPLCGLKGYKATSLKKITSRCTYPSIGTEILIRGVKLGLDIGQVNINCLKRLNGQSTFGIGIKPNFKIMRAIFYGMLISKKGE